MSRSEDDFADKMAGGLLSLWFAICIMIYTVVFAAFVFLTHMLLSSINQATNGALERNRIVGVIISAVIFLVGCSIVAPALLAITGLQIEMSLFWASVSGTVLGIAVGINIMFGDGNEIASAESTGDFTDVLDLPPELYTPIPDTGTDEAQPHATELSLADIDALFGYPGEKETYVGQTGESNGYYFG